MVVSALVVSGLALTHIDWVLYPLALISSAGVLVLLGMIYTIVILMAFRMDNHYERLSQAIFPILARYYPSQSCKLRLMDIGRYLAYWHLG